MRWMIQVIAQEWAKKLRVVDDLGDRVELNEEEACELEELPTNQFSEIIGRLTWFE